MKTRIRQLRALANLTQVQLGKAIGVAGKTISMWELGASEPSDEQLNKLAAFFAERRIMFGLEGVIFGPKD